MLETRDRQETERPSETDQTRRFGRATVMAG